MTLDNYKLTLLTAIFIFFITLPIRGQIKFPSYQPAEPNFRTATQPEAQTQQFYSITSEEGQATIQVEKKQYNPTAVPNASRNNQPNYNTNGLKLSSDKTVKSYGGGTGATTTQTGKTGQQNANVSAGTVQLPLLKKYSNNEDYTYTQENGNKQLDENNPEMNKLPGYDPSDPGTGVELPIPSGITVLLLCALLYLPFIKRNTRKA